MWFCGSATYRNGRLNGESLASLRNMVIIKSDYTKPGISPAKQLAEHDDMCINLTIDVHLGFITHKMSARFRPIKANQGLIRETLSKLQSSTDIERACGEIMKETGQWSNHYFLNKSRTQIDAFKSHVSEVILF